MIYFTIDWWYIVKISYSLIYFECNGAGTDGTFTGTDDTGMSFDGTGTGTDSTSTDSYDLAQSYHIFTDGFWGYLQSKKKHWLTQWTI